jgi:hypothetical protein
MRKLMLLTGVVFMLSLMVASAETPRSPRSAPVPEVGVFLAGLADSAPAPIQRTSCTVSLECICGGGTVTISCSGDVSCLVHLRSVECDSVYEHCPPIGSCPH